MLGKSGVDWVSVAIPFVATVNEVRMTEKEMNEVYKVLVCRGEVFASFQSNRQVRAEERYKAGKAKVKQLKISKDPKGELRR